MKKTLIGAWLLLVLAGAAFAQSSHQLKLGLFGVAGAFQDQKYSDVHFGGPGAGIQLSHDWSKPKFLLQSSFSVNGGSEKAATHSNGKATVFRVNFNSRYLHQVKEGIHLGLSWDIFDLYFRSTSELQNNSSYFNSSSVWYLSGRYQRGVWNGKALTVGLDLGLASFFKESTGFAFSTSQNVLEDGNFNYQDESILGPFGLKHFILQPVWKQLNLRVQTALQLSRRWTVEYRWSLRRFSSVKGYPTTIAQHQLGAHFLLLSRPKSPKS